MISGRNEADRFLMGLLRAFADAVLIGAGTMRDTPGHLWTPGHVFPALAAEFAELRKRLGRKTEPRLVLLTASGELDQEHPAIEHGALILTTKAGERKLDGRLPNTCEVVTLAGGDRLDMVEAVDHLKKTGYNVVLCEGGPHVIGQLLDDGLLEEIFLTISPVVAGRAPDSARLALVEGIEFLPKVGRWAELKSARRHGSHLFLRYGFSGPP
jgi:riboflavin biosynthesis pyrimidine reductase